MGKYDDDLKELSMDQLNWVISYLYNNFEDIIKETIGYNDGYYKDKDVLYCTYEWSQSTDHHYYDKTPVLDAQLEKALIALNNEIHKGEATEAFREEYGEAVGYFYNNAYIDDNGIFLKQTLGFRKYFTRFELDEIKDRFDNTKSKRKY